MYTVLCTFQGVELIYDGSPSERRILDGSLIVQRIHKKIEIMKGIIIGNSTKQKNLSVY